MKRNYIFLSIIAGFLFLSSCEQFQEADFSRKTDWICFNASDGIEGCGVVQTRAMENEITCDITDWDYEGDGTASDVKTKASLTETLSGYAGVFGYSFTTWDSSVKPEVMYNLKNTFDEGTLTPESKVLWKDYKSGNMRFYAYVPYGKFTLSSKSEGGVPYLTYTVPTTNKDQIDILYAQSWDVTYASDHNEAVPLQFKHAMTAVQFRLGIDGATLTQVKVSKIKNSGKLSLDGIWSDVTGDETFTITHQDSLLLMIPQTLASGPAAADSAMVTLTYTLSGESHTIKASIGATKWPVGKKVVYTLKKKTTDVEYIYFDFSAGDIILTETNYTGYVFVNGDTTKVFGDHVATNKYYIYQSAPATLVPGNSKVWSANTGYESESDFNNRANVKPRLPQYSEITVGGKSWGEYVTNNTDPAAILATWNNKSICPENFLEPTPRRILISGDSQFDVTLDRVYSRYYPYRGNATGDLYEGVVSIAPSGTGDSRQYKDVYGGITIGQSSLDRYNKSWTGRSYREKVTLRLKGNNYFSRIEYSNRTDSTGLDGYLKITSEKGDGIAEGTLTVTLPYLRTAHPTDDGLWNFVRCALIGGGSNDTNANTNLKYRQVRELFFEGGIVYCGVEKIRNSNWKTNENMISPIGTNNAEAQITINGGIVTAVSNGTGPAIGGGAGWVRSGGKGIVTINGGTVYAYSFGVYNANSSVNAPVMSAAIGGGSSGNVKGAEGAVYIYGGTVHAYSVGGCAIGGGTSGTLVGGDGTVTIEGGNIFANSVSGKIGTSYTATAGVAIGGGRSGISSGNGGDAIVTITGGKIVAGSVGGGQCGNDKGKLGRAVVDVSGGETSAQFLLVKDKSVETANKFTMKDGVIKNSSTSDTEYTKVKPDGGAVYIESGTCQIKGGTISGCLANLGGAVYMNGGTFNMSGGIIKDCKANTDGGAVYIEGGDVNMSGTGTIHHNVASKGNGGGVHIKGGNFTMTGGNITNNVANPNYDTYTDGNGGGIYISSTTSNVSVNIAGGNVQSNTAERNGGGLYVETSGGATADIVIGTVGGLASTPDISLNYAELTGGGMAVLGEGSNITINSGTVKGNVSTVMTNMEIRNDLGTVTLVGKNTPGQPDQVNVLYTTIYFYANNESDPEPYDEQRVITATNSLLNPPAAALNFKKRHYHIDSWNTKRDGTGESYEVNGGTSIMNITSDVVLYAQWVGNLD